MTAAMLDFDVAIVGAGIVGLACASRLALDGKRVVVLEQHARFGEETSSRNSGVIHAGLYYPAESLKAQSCVEGRILLYERCERLGIAHKKTGKLVVATSPEELQWLLGLEERALRNNAGAVRMLSASELRQMEPNVQAIGALFSPESGIVDVHGLMYSHQVQAREAGATFSFQSQVVGLLRTNWGWNVEVQTRSDEPFVIGAAVVVNAAGLHGEKLTELAGVDTRALGYRYHWCKGDYFSVAARHRGLVQRLVYPVPSHAGLGVHITLGLDGSLNAGPDAEYIGALDYDVREDKAVAFAAALRRYLPAISEGDLKPGYSGIRPKLQGPGDPFRDFVVTELGEHGAPGFIALLGIESPGLTASEALSGRVATLVQGLS